MCDKHSQKFDDVSQPVTRSAPGGSSPAKYRPDQAAERRLTRKHSAADTGHGQDSGIEVSDRGRIRPMSWQVRGRSTTRLNQLQMNQALAGASGDPYGGPRKAGRHDPAGMARASGLAGSRPGHGISSTGPDSAGPDSLGRGGVMGPTAGRVLPGN